MKYNLLVVSTTGISMKYNLLAVNEIKDSI